VLRRSLMLLAVFLNLGAAALGQTYTQNAQAIVKAGGGIMANNPTFTGTLTGPTVVAGSAPIFSGPLTSQTYGSPAINVSSQFWGIGSGSKFPTSGTDQFPSIGIGSYSLANYTALGAETTCTGALSCQFLTTGSLDTAFGMHALGSETVANNNVAIGNDALRDAITNGGSVTAVGQGAGAHGNNSRGIFIGQTAGQGYSSAVLLTGTITAGNTVTLGLTNGGSTIVTNLPYSYTYTVQGGDTLASIANTLCSNLNSKQIQGPSYQVSCGAINLQSSGYLLQLAWPGTQSVGWQLTPSASTAQGTGGSNTLSAALINGTQFQGGTIVGAFAAAYPTASLIQNATCIGDSACSTIGGNSITAIGFNALNSVQNGFGDTATGTGAGYATTTGQYDVYMGINAGTAVTTGSTNTIVGGIAAPNMTTQSDDVVVGFWAGNGLSTGSGNNTVVGARSLYVATTAANNSVFGHGILQTTFTGSGAVFIGSGAKTVEPVSSSSVGEINVENVYRNYSSTPAITSGQAIGTFPTITGGGSHVFKAVVGVSPTGTTETLTFSAAANGWYCKADDITTSTNTAKVTGSTATSVTLTWSGTPTASDVILHMCDAY